MLKKIIGMTNSNIIYSFFASNLLALISILILPISAVRQDMMQLTLLNAFFVVGTSIIGILFYKLLTIEACELKYDDCRKEVSISDKILNLNIKILTIGPLIGFIFLFIDRVFIREIDYLQGLRLARYDWLETSGGGVLGVVGNLLVPLSYVGILLLITNFERIHSKKILVFSIVVSIVGVAALNGGRSNLLLALVMIVVGFIIVKNKSFKIKIFSLGGAVFSLIGVGCFYYIIYIIESSASMGGVTLDQLLVPGIEALYGAPHHDFFESKHSYLMNILIYIFSYLYHGQWTAQYSFFLTDRPGLYSITSLPIVMLTDLKLLDLNLSNKAFSDTGAFISLPGAFFYDFGWPGVFFITLFLGLSLGVVMFFLRRRKAIGAMKICFIVTVLYVLLLSPIVPAWGLSYFYFIIFSFIFLSVINFFFLQTKLKFL